MAQLSLSLARLDQLCLALRTFLSAIILQCKQKSAVRATILGQRHATEMAMQFRGHTYILAYFEINQCICLPTDLSMYLQF